MEFHVKIASDWLENCTKSLGLGRGGLLFAAHCILHINGQSPPGVTDRVQRLNPRITRLQIFLFNYLPKTRTKIPKNTKLDIQVGCSKNIKLSDDCISWLLIINIKYEINLYLVVKYRKIQKCTDNNKDTFS